MPSSNSESISIQGQEEQDWCTIRYPGIQVPEIPTQPCHIFVLVKFCNFPTFTRISLENVCIVLLIKSLLPSSIVYALFDWKTLANELKLYPYYYAETTVVWGITGAFVSVVSTPRLLAVGERLLVSLRSVKLLCLAWRLDFVEKESLKYTRHVLHHTNFVSVVKWLDNFNFVCYLHQDSV